jgi:hypothetical protein
MFGFPGRTRHPSLGAKAAQDGLQKRPDDIRSRQFVLVAVPNPPSLAAEREASPTIANIASQTNKTAPWDLLDPERANFGSS